MKKLTVAIAVVMGVVLICGMVLVLGDDIFNRKVGDWFERTFMFETSYEIEDAAGNSHFIREVHFMWASFKSYVELAALTVVGLWTGSIVLTVFIGRRRRAEDRNERITGLLRQYFSPNNPNPQPFPKEFTEIALCAGEIKDQMQRKEQQLQREAAQKNDLIAYLAHDLKTPLTSVIGYLSLLEEAPDMPPEQKAKYTHIAREKALRLEALINEFFEITRYNLHEIALEMEPIDLSYMLTQMADEFYPVLAGHGNTITVDAPEDLLLPGDSQKLARVFNNILKNAIAYSYRDSPITIRAAQEGNTIAIRFANHGRNIPQQRLESIFEKFYRLDGARSSNTGGAGLGLAIAREIVTCHGGTITAASENEITTFTVSLPATYE